MAKLVYDKDGRLLFTKEMKEEYTILMPQMLPVHFGMFRQLLELEGYKVDMLTTNHRGAVCGGRGAEICPQRHLLSRPSGHRPAHRRHQKRRL